MMNFIPIFPLSLVVFPGENLNLHIFEPRYKQLIQECHEHGKPFGIPVVLDNAVKELGSLMMIKEIVRKYDNGEMDITTEGIKVFKILEKLPTVPDKLYSGAIVEYPDNLEDGDPGLMKLLHDTVQQLHNMLQVKKKFEPKLDALRSYDLGHHAGLSIVQEFELLGLFSERQRQEYLRRHLKNVLPIVSELEALKEKVRLNGHFKNLSGFGLEG